MSVYGLCYKFCQLRTLCREPLEMYFYVFFFVSSAGEVEFQRAVPDTLTTWVTSAFAVSNVTGLGVGELKPQVSVTF